jgi:hypothetical protein
VVAAAVISASVVGTPASAAEGPRPPANLRVTSAGFDALSFAWSRSPDDDGRGAGFFYQVLLDGMLRSGSYEPSVSVSDLRAGHTYRVEVRSLDTLTNQVSSPVAVSASTLRDTVAPTTPRHLRADAVGLMWDASTDNRGIGFYRVFGNGQHLFSVSATEIGFSFMTDTYPLVRHGQTLTVTVQAVDLTGLSSGLARPLTVTVP